jgi:hypothetical protein
MHRFPPCVLCGLLVLAALAAALVPLAAAAATPEDVARDLRTIEAQVAMASEKEVVLNRGLVSGVQEGDLFTIFREGAPVKDPGSGRTIGVLEEPVALVQVESVQDLIAVGRPLLQLGPLTKGLRAVRYKEIPTLLVDLERSAGSFQYQSRVKLLLKQLDWAAPRPGDETLVQEWSEARLQERGINLVFVLAPGELLMFNRKGQPLRRWEREAAAVAPPPPAPAVGPPAAAAPSLAAGPYRKLASLDQLVIGLAVADLDGDGVTDLLYLTPGKLVWRPGASGGREAAYPYEGFGRILNFSLSAYGVIALNIVEPGRRMISQLLQVEGGRFKVLAEDINYVLGFFDADGRGRADVLLGQAYRRETLMGGPLVRFELKEGRFAEAGEIPVPLDCRIIGASFYGAPGPEGPGLAYINAHHKLVIQDGGGRPWMSPRRVGGSMHSVSVQFGTDKLGLDRAVAVETPPLALPEGGPGDNRLLVVANQSSHFNLFGGIPSFESGSILLVQTGELGRRLEPITQPFDGAVQGLAFAAGEVYCALVTGNALTEEFQSHIVAIPLATHAR